MRTRIVGALAGLLLLPAAPASAAELMFSAGTDERGLPMILPWAYPRGEGRIDTYICPNGTGCHGPHPMEIRDFGGGSTVSVGTPAPGTVFEARLVENDQVVATTRSPAWTGTLTNRTPPVVAGDLVVGGTVTLTPGTWDGGWAAPWETWAA